MRRFEFRDPEIGAGWWGRGGRRHQKGGRVYRKREGSVKQGGGDRFLACLRESESASFGLCCGNVLGLCQPQQCGALLRHAKLRANLEFEKSDRPPYSILLSLQRKLVDCSWDVCGLAQEADEHHRNRLQRSQLVPSPDLANTIRSKRRGSRMNVSRWTGGQCRSEIDITYLVENRG
eukprot:2695970-Rhodomonas_salina.1